ncbi:MAG: AAA family ATPase [Gemmatimonadales bacterium]|nr:AAA family ATPase [Gemmatimonadales bacterium]NIN11799.1 AAA family ATPase [Gemmatimonadales bacterium]NIN50349.1 AAA family ATPase [Gemmatimonadales bacterium]NIP07813.1 AAA family ATPase [Gemmatimonadales bacterium]NIR01891.1 AAA family ATPase [Gemmatimonadales bacterium]
MRDSPAPTEAASALLLTGLPGVGKTTVIQEVARLMPAATVRGFYTQEIRQGGVRRGFQLIPFDGEIRTLAHVNHASEFRVGKYRVDVAMLEQFAGSLLRPDPAATVYLIDEIGKMECFSQQFVTAVRRLLDAHVPVVAAVASRGGGFIAEVKRRPDVVTWEVTRSNRDELPARAVEWVRERGAMDERE